MRAGCVLNPFSHVSRQGYWSGLPCPSPGDLPELGIKPMSPTMGGGSLPLVPSGKPTRAGYSFLTRI